MGEGGAVKNVEGFVTALEAYLDGPLSRFNPEELAEHAQDLLTDLEHWAEQEKIRVDERQAHLRYLQESGRCFGCGMTLAEIKAEAAADPEYTKEEECAGEWDRLGQAGPHSWNEFPLPRKTTAEEAKHD
jgi:O-succinylbenzoate synthase